MSGKTRQDSLFLPSPKIISVSRRTDVPAFHSGWFMERLREGGVAVRHPYSKKISDVSLRPEDVSCFVFWSKDFSPLIPHLDEIEGVTRRLYFHFTITGIPKDLELRTPDYRDAAGDFISLAQRYSPEHLVWRFDPICITDRLPFDYYRETFSALAEMLEGSCTRCYISFVTRYRKTDHNVHRYSGHRMLDVPEETERAYAAELAEAGARHGIRLYACCNDHLFSDKVLKGSCINGNDLARLFGDPAPGIPPSPTRRECACTRSVDIGAYNTCRHGCLYCYASDGWEKTGSM